MPGDRAEAVGAVARLGPDDELDQRPGCVGLVGRGDLDGWGAVGAFALSHAPALWMDEGDAGAAEPRVAVRHIDLPCQIATASPAPSRCPPLPASSLTLSLGVADATMGHRANPSYRLVPGSRFCRCVARAGLRARRAHQLRSVYLAAAHALERPAPRPSRTATANAPPGPPTDQNGPN